MSDENWEDWRLLTPEELNQIVIRLEALPEQVAACYEFPIAHVIASSKASTPETKNYVEVDETGEPLRYLLHFRSPAWTWEILCGREGRLIVDAKTLEFVKFGATKMN
jgi:hypothetical protein